MGADWLIIMREVSDAATIDAMRLFFKLTAREAEVLYWVVKGKTTATLARFWAAAQPRPRSIWSAFT